jgi:hypothetical protein
MSLKTIRTLVTAAAAFLLLIGCGSEQSTPEPQEPAAKPKAEAPREPEQENKIVEKMHSDGKGMDLTATDPEGNKFVASIGENIEIPDQFPDDVPVFPGSTPMAYMSTPDEGIIVTFKSAEAQQDIYDFYESSLADGGWEVLEGEVFNKNQLSIDALKDTRKVSVIIAGPKGESRVSVIVTPAS